MIFDGKFLPFKRSEPLRNKPRVPVKNKANVTLMDFDRTLRKTIRDLGQRADDKKIPAYVVGGIVRDMLLQRKNLDCDIVIEGDAITLAREYSRATQTALTVYPQFKTATLFFSGGLEVDLASARKEHYPYPGALPVVEPGSINDDLFRRDFTINAMAVRINRKGFGELVDFFGGKDDLLKKRIRILHARSFEDDPTRILRAIRFEQRLGFNLEQQTQMELKRALENKAWLSVKPPRYFAEFRKYFKEDRPSKPIHRLDKLGGMDFIQKCFHPPVALMQRLQRKICLLRKQTSLAQEDWGAVYLLALCKGFKKRDAEKFCSTFHLTRAERLALLTLPRIETVKKQLSRPGLRPSRVYQILRDLRLEVIFFMLAGSSTETLTGHLNKFLRRTRFMKLSVSGYDLKDTGATGKRLGMILEQVLLQRIDGRIHSPAQELREARKLAAQLSPERKNHGSD